MTELTIDQALQQGIEAHKAGQVKEADRLYTAILKAQPKHPDANHNMGVLAVGFGKVEQALPFFKTALEANPAKAQFWLSYIDALIKLGELAEAKAMLDQAKSKGAKGDGFDKLEQRLSEVGAEHVVASKITAEVPPQRLNILDGVKLDQALKLAKKKAKEGSLEEAKRIYQDILTKFPKNKRARDGLKGLTGRTVGKAYKVQDPPQEQLQLLSNLYSQGELQQALKQAGTLVQQFPQSAILFNIQGAVLKGLGQLDASVEAYNTALAIKPDYAEAYSNIGNALKDQGRLEEAIEAYSKALTIKPDSAETYNNMGNALREQGKLEEAIKAYRKSIMVKPNYGEAYNNMGNTLKEQGKFEEAIAAYQKVSHRSPTAKALECSYILENYNDFDINLSSISKKDPTNIRVAAMSTFAAHQRRKEDPYPFCPNPMDLIKFSHVQNHVSDPDNFIASILEEMNEKDAVWEPQNKTTKGGFQSNSKLFDNPSPNMIILEEIIKKELRRFRADFNNNESILFQKWPDEIKIEAWYVRMLQNGHQESHIHPTGWVSGVFYLKTVESPIDHEGAIEFGLHGYNYPIINENYPRRLYQPLNGDLVLFPSSLFHKTIPVIKNAERCVIAFDLVRQT